MTNMNNFKDLNASLDRSDSSFGDFLGKPYYYVPSSVARVMSASAVTQTMSSGESLQNMIGLSDLVYTNSDPDHNLPQKNATIKVNDVNYLVVDVEDDSSGYEGMVLLDSCVRCPHC